MITKTKKVLITAVAAIYLGLSSYVMYHESKNPAHRKHPREGRTLDGDYMYDLNHDGLVDIIRREQGYLAVAKRYEEQAAPHLRHSSFHIMTKEERDVASKILQYQEEFKKYQEKLSSSK